MRPEMPTRQPGLRQKALVRNRGRGNRNGEAGDFAQAPGSTAIDLPRIGGILAVAETR
jgi:hypothetical protein